LSPANLLRAAELAQSRLQSERAGTILSELAAPGAESNRYIEAKRRYVQAAFLKDTEQEAAVRRILDLVAEGLALVAQPDDSAKPEEWRELRVQLFQKRLDTRLFLKGDSEAEVCDDVQALKDATAGTPAYANLLCTLAERAMKAPSAEVNWREVSGWLAEASKVLINRYKYDLSYLQYQYGQYWRKKPDANKREAVKRYRAADRSACDVGEAVRQGLARLRWVELRWETLANLDAETASEQLEEVIPRVAAALFVGGTVRTRFAARVLERLYSLRAETGRAENDGSIERSLREACRAGEATGLHGATDRRRFGVAVCRLLEHLWRVDDATGFEGIFLEYEPQLCLECPCRLSGMSPEAVLQQLRHTFPE
jgi:hypothetical protein